MGKSDLSYIGGVLVGLLMGGGIWWAGAVMKPETHDSMAPWVFGAAFVGIIIFLAVRPMPASPDEKEGV